MRAGESWEEIWASRERQGALHRAGAFLARFGDLQRIVHGSLSSTGMLRRGLRVLEVGSGTAPVMKRLKGITPNRYGVDISITAARLSGEHCFSAAADGRALPFADRSFDLVYSTGVLDQLRRDDAASVLRESRRVLADGGRILAVTAHGGCRLHGMIKGHLEGRNRWPYGRKDGFLTLSGILPEGLEIVSEKRRGALFQLRFISYLFPERRFLRTTWNLFFLLLSAALFPLNLLPGALLVTEMRKR